MRLKTVAFTASILLLHPNLFGEVISDGVTSTVVTPIPETGVFEISGGHLDSEKGTNLFHSFQQFGLSSSEHAAFMNSGIQQPDQVQNILARVTGNHPSNIYGQISTRDFANANLYLINPNGIFFGEGASLSIAGSFYATTADYIRLGNSERFYASLSKESTFSSASPSAFGFLDPPAPVSVKNTLLTVPDGQTLSMIGGDLDIENSCLCVTGGRVNLAAVASAGEVIPGPDFLKTEPESMTKGTIKMFSYYYSESNSQSKWNNKSVDVSGNGGQIFIRAGNFFAETALIQADTCDGYKEGLVNIAIDEDMHLNKSTQIAANNKGKGQGTSIAVSANTLEIGDIDAEGLGYFLAGELEVFPDGQYTQEELIQRYPQLEPEDTRDFLETARLLVGPHGEDEPPPISFERVIETFGKQKLAEKYRRNLFVRVFNLISIGNRSDYPTAGGGKIQIDVQNLHMDTGMIEAYTVGGGNAGEITMNANNVTLTGLSGINAASFVNTNEETGGVTLENGGGRGDAGEIHITSDNLLVSDYSYISVGADEKISGKGGNLTLDVSSLRLDQVGRISSYSYGTNNAGDINLLDANRVSLNNGSSISTGAANARGGNISLQINDKLEVTNHSRITAEDWGELREHDAGNLTIWGNHQWLFLDKGSALLASAKGGKGGNINLTAKYLFGPILVNPGVDHLENLLSQSNSVIDATSKRNIDGTVTVYGQLWTPNNPWTLLRFTETHLSLSRCASFSKDHLSRFLITARDILPRSPEDLRTHTIRLQGGGR